MNTVEKNDQLINKLLSLKFTYFGDDLNNRIQEIKKSEEWQLCDFKEYLTNYMYNDHNKKDNIRVSVYVEKDKMNNQEIGNSLIAAAYFPEELDPETKTSPIANLSKFKFIHRQLADVLSYGHPLARKYLKMIMSICNVPLDDPEFMNNFYYVADSDLKKICLLYIFNQSIDFRRLCGFKRYATFWSWIR